MCVKYRWKRLQQFMRQNRSFYTKCMESMAISICFIINYIVLIKQFTQKNCESVCQAGFALMVAMTKQS
jgi:hypothetical protein